MTTKQPKTRQDARKTARSKSSSGDGRAKTRSAKKKRGRPSAFTPKLAREICDRIAKGEYLVDICDAPGMPSDSTVSGWAVDDRDGFFGMYTRAEQIRCLRLKDEILKIADESRDDFKTIERNGREFDVVDKEAILRSQIRIDARKWLMAKLYPKLFGEKLQIDASLTNRRITAAEAAEALKKRIAENRAKYEAK